MTKKPSNPPPSNFKGLPQNLEQTTKDEVLCFVFFFSQSHIAAKEFVISGTAFCFRREIWSENFYSEKTLESFWATFFGDRRQLRVALEETGGRSLALWARPAGTDCHHDVSLFLPQAESRGGFSTPAANSAYLLLSTAALVANKFYGAVAWLGFYSFFKSKTGNMQSKAHICIFFDIHGELLPAAHC